MRRRIFTAMSLMSGVLCVAVCVMDYRSRAIDEAIWINNPVYGGVRSSAGELQFSFGDGGMRQPRWSLQYGKSEMPTGCERMFNFRFAGWSHGFEYGSFRLFANHFSRQQMTYTTRFVVIPHWFASTVLVVFFCLWIVSLVKRRKACVPGHCAACGYDLRGSLGTCPECGSVSA